MAWGSFPIFRSMARRPTMSEQVLQQEQDRIKALFLEVATREAEGIAALLTGSATEVLLGNTEFALRDAVLKSGAKTLEAATNERAKKRGTKGAARRGPLTLWRFQQVHRRWPAGLVLPAGRARRPFSAVGGGRSVWWRSRRNRPPDTFPDRRSWREPSVR